MTTTLPVVHQLDLETVYLIWLDASANGSTENLDVQKQFRAIIPQFQAFENEQECEKYIRQKSSNDRIFFIVSGRLGREIVPRIHQFRQIYSVYVYCQDKQRNEEWANKFTKVRGVLIKLDQLINQIQSDYSKRLQLKIDEPFPINISKSNILSQNNEFFHSQIILDCLFQLKTIPTDKTELIHLCKKNYQHDNNQLSIIQEFQQKYISNQSIWWYTREAFLSRLVTKALSMKNLDLLFLLGFFLRDMQENLQKNKCKSAIQVYHGQLMSIEELQTLQNSIGGYISINTFFLANYNRKQVITSFNEYPVSKEFTRILFEIDANPQAEQSKPFANITPFVYLSQEQQILFSLGSVFQLMNLQQDKQNGLWIVKIVFSNIKKDYDSTNLMSYGHILQQLKQYDHAEKYFSRLLKELPSNHPNIPQCYQSLGLLYFLKTNYDLSLEWYQKLVKTSKPNDPNFADSYYAIGCVYQKIFNYNQALQCYDKALAIWKEICGDGESRHMADCLNNMGCIYEIEQDYSNALECHKKALTIRDKYQMDIGASYNNIGNIYLCLGEYVVALENYNYSLEIKKKSLSIQDPSSARTIRNIGLVYEYDEEFEEALKFYKRAALMFDQIYPGTHVYKMEIQEDIQRVSSSATARCLDSSFENVE